MEDYKEGYKKSFCCGEMSISEFRLYQRIVGRWLDGDPERTLAMTREECHGLIMAVRNWKERWGQLSTESRNDVARKIADVQILLGALTIIFDPKAVARAKKEAMAKLETRLGNRL